MAEEDETLLKGLEDSLNKLKSTKINPDSLYNFLNTVASIVFAYMERKEDNGWAANVTNMDGNEAFPTADEQKKVESFMNEYGPQIMVMLQLVPAPAEQAGGATDTDPAAVASSKDNALKALESLSEFIDPRSVSLDGAVEFILEYLDSANTKMEDMARQIGFIKLENTVHGVPLQPIGIPYEIPTRLLIIIVQGIFEIMRLFSLFGFPGAGIFRVVGSLFGGLIELFKGDWKSALFTFMGLAGNGMMTMGLFGKIIVKVFSFMAPSARDKLVITGIQSMKSWILGVAVFLFQTLAPFSIKQLVDKNLGTLGEMLGKVQEQINLINTSITAAPEFRCFEMTWLNLTDPAKFPDYDSLIKFQDLFMQPAFYCNNDVRAFVDEIKFVPPARIILELLGLPTTDRAYGEVCWNLPDSVIKAGLPQAILHSLKPIIRPRAPYKPATKLPEGTPDGTTLEQYNKQQEAAYIGKYKGCSGFDEEGMRVAAEAARKSLENKFSLGAAADSGLRSIATSLTGSTKQMLGNSVEAVSGIGAAAKGTIAQLQALPGQMSQQISELPGQMSQQISALPGQMLERVLPQGMQPVSITVGNQMPQMPQMPTKPPGILAQASQSIQSGLGGSLKSAVQSALPQQVQITRR